MTLKIIFATMMGLCVSNSVLAAEVVVVQGRVRIHSFSGDNAELEVRGVIKAISQSCAHQSGKVFNGGAVASFRQVPDLKNCNAATITLDVSRASLCQNTGAYVPPRVVSIQCAH